jgi:hypothetical protein
MAPLFTRLFPLLLMAVVRVLGRRYGRTYLIGHVLLFGILTLKGCVPSAGCVLVAMVYVGIRTDRLKRKFSGRATALSLQKCVDLADVDQGGYESLNSYSTDEGKAVEASWRADSLRQRADGVPQPVESTGLLGGLFGGSRGSVKES